MSKGHTTVANIDIASTFASAAQGPAKRQLKSQANNGAPRGCRTHSWASGFIIYLIAPADAPVCDESGGDKSAAEAAAAAAASSQATTAGGAASCLIHTSCTA
jgi:hypothetical protein